MKPRPLIVEFLDFNREKVRGSRGNLPENIRVSEDFPTRLDKGSVSS